METCKKMIFFYALCFSLFHGFLGSQSQFRRYKFVVKEAAYTRLCESKKILTVNGKFPGPTLYAHKGDTLIVDVYNRGNYNITLHWHGVKQPRNPWSDGPEYVTQCPIKPGKKFTQKIIFSEEEGTIWWHAHSDWSRATVHGAIIIYPQPRTGYPFPKPHAEVPIIFGEWWRADVMAVLNESQVTGNAPNVSDAFTINGQPGDLYPCSNHSTFKQNVHHGRTYLLRLVNAALNNILFFAVADHNLTVVATDAGYTKPLTFPYVVISPGQSLDCILHADQHPGRYYMAARSYSSSSLIAFDNTTTTAVLHYAGNHNSSISPLPSLPYYNDTAAAFRFFGALRSLSNRDHPIEVPQNPTTQIFSTLSINTFPCRNNSCAGPNGTRLAGSMNNISWVNPPIDILEAYYYHRNTRVFGTRFPNFPPELFNFTAEYLPLELEIPRRGTEVKVLRYNTTVEMVMQGTNLVAGIDHPMHLHGYSFSIVGWGFGNFDKFKDPLGYNLVDPPHRNTVVVPRNGWVTIRFKATNPGVWFMHCHLERHLTWGMEMVFIVRDGHLRKAQMLPPPPHMPPC